MYVETGITKNLFLKSVHDTCFDVLANLFKLFHYYIEVKRLGTVAIVPYF